MLIEDDAGSARLIGQVLRSLELPLYLTRAETAEAAMILLENCERFSRRNPDLILLDLHLGRHQGFDMLAFLKKTPRYRTIPVVVLAGSKNRADIHRAYDLHANALVHKGTTFDEIHDTLSAICGLWLRAAERPNRVEE